MAFGSTPADSNQIPVSAGYVPGVGFKAIQAGYVFTDASSNDSAPMVVHASDGYKATYAFGAGNIIPAATLNDWVQLTGSSTKIIRITRVMLFNNAASATTNVWANCYIRTSAGATGSTASDSIVQLDSSDPAATATMLRWTTKPTTQSSGGGSVLGFDMPTPASGNTLTFDFGLPGGAKCPMLRGTSQFFVIALGGNAMPASTNFGYQIVFTEE